MRRLLSFLLIAALNRILVDSRAQNLFSPDSSSSFDSAFISDLALSNTEKSIPGLDDPALNPNKLFDTPKFSSSLDDISDTDTSGIPWDDGFVTPNPLDLATPQQSCQAEEDSQMSGFLQARDGELCLPKKVEDLELPLDLGTEPWWRRIFPLTEPATELEKKPSPSGDILSIFNPRNVPEISPDSFNKLFEEFKRDKKCPREFPIRCCSDYTVGLRLSPQTRAVYFIYYNDCAQIFESTPCYLRYDACCQYPGAGYSYYCIIMNGDPLSS